MPPKAEIMRWDLNLIYAFEVICLSKEREKWEMSKIVPNEWGFQFNFKGEMEISNFGN